MTAAYEYMKCDNAMQLLAVITADGRLQLSNRAIAVITADGRVQLSNRYSGDNR